MYISKATKQDTTAIKCLLEKSGKNHFKNSDINNRDISWCARTEKGKLIGYIWCGFMSNGKTAFIDHLCVDPEYAKLGISKDLCTQMALELLARQTEQLIAFSINDPHQIKVLKSTQKTILGAKPKLKAKVTQGFMLEIWNRE